MRSGEPAAPRLSLQQTQWLGGPRGFRSAGDPCLRLALPQGLMFFCLPLHLWIPAWALSCMWPSGCRPRRWSRCPWEPPSPEHAWATPACNTHTHTGVTQPCFCSCCCAALLHLSPCSCAASHLLSEGKVYARCGKTHHKSDPLNVSRQLCMEKEQQSHPQGQFALISSSDFSLISVNKGYQQSWAPIFPQTAVQAGIN